MWEAVASKAQGRPILRELALMPPNLNLYSKWELSNNIPWWTNQRPRAWATQRNNQDFLEIKERSIFRDIEFWCGIRKRYGRLRCKDTPNRNWASYCLIDQSSDRLIQTNRTGRRRKADWQPRAIPVKGCARIDIGISYRPSHVLHPSKHQLEPSL